MNKLFLIFIIFVLFSCGHKKENQETTPKSDKKIIEKLTEIEFDEKTHDFGEIISGEILVYTFVFTNTGENDFNIEKVETDCGCVNIDYLKEPVKPGKKGLIEIEFDSSGMFGKQLKSIEIHSNCKETKHLVIFATVKNEQLEIIY